jgi:serine/threonine-protein kinase
MFDTLRFPTDPEAHTGFRLEELQVDPATGALTGPGGREQLDPKVMAVLLALARNPGELVTRAQLLEAIWPGGAVYDDALTQCVYQLRQQLVAAGGANRYRKLIKTLPKRGYLLSGAVLPANPAAAADVTAIRRPRRRVLGLLVLLLVVAGTWWLLERAGGAGAGREIQAPVETPLPRSIAVLPFINVSGDPANDYLSEGISDELRDRLSALPDWRVAARRSSVRLRDSPDDARAIGRQLGVGRILEGRFDRARDQVIVAVELVDAVSGFQLWAQSYEHASSNLMLVEQALAGDIIRNLSPLLASGAEAAPPSAQQMAAHDLMLLGRQYERQVTEEQRVDEAKLARAIELYSQAIEIDPPSAEAHARLGRMLLYQGEVTRAEPHILKALELDPTRADSFTTLGLYYWAVREEGIGAAYRRAIELNPSDADALSYYASWNWLQGNANEAVAYYRAALEIDPLSLLRYADLGYKLAFQGSRPEALAVLELLTQLFPTAPGYLAAARITEALGDLDEAVAWALKARDLRPDDSDVAGQLAELLARLDDFEAAARLEPVPGMGQLFWQRRYPELVDLGEELLFEEPVDTDTSFLLAFALSALGRQEQAIAQLEATGLPETVLSESRRAGELHALHTYVGALRAIGRDADARQLASWALDFNRSLLASEGIEGWLPRLSEACSLTVLGRREEALAWLETLPPLGTLAWLPWLQDLACFDALEAEPRYQAVVAAIELRIGEIRARLPDTLARHGLSLPVR